MFLLLLLVVAGMGMGRSFRWRQRRATAVAGAAAAGGYTLAVSGFEYKDAGASEVEVRKVLADVRDETPKVSANDHMPRSLVSIDCKQAGEWECVRG